VNVFKISGTWGNLGEVSIPSFIELKQLCFSKVSGLGLVDLNGLKCEKGPAVFWYFR
jgi:hypothetical protein